MNAKQLFEHLIAQLEKEAEQADDKAPTRDGYIAWTQANAVLPVIKTQVESLFNLYKKL